MATTDCARAGVFAAVVLCLLFTACGGPPSQPPTQTQPPPADDVHVSIDPAAATLEPGQTQDFTATVTGSTDTAVGWSTTGGTIAGSGTSVTYVAPEAAGSYSVTATSVADPAASATAAVVVNATAAPPGHEGAWTALGEGTDGAVRAMVTDRNGHLYVGGSFTRAGGATVNRIAKWDGSSWSALGTGIVVGGVVGNAHVSALALDQDGNLYAGGWFDTAGGVAVRNVAMWDGSQWHALGDPPFAPNPTTGAVDVLATDSKGHLYAGGSWGDSAQRGEIVIQGIARWDGSTWTGIGPHYGEDVIGRPYQGVAASVSALVIDESDNVYVGGRIRTAGGEPTSGGVVMWDGERWNALGTGIEAPGSLSSLALHGGNLYVGGIFTVAGDVIADNVAVWNGTEWSALGGGIPPGGAPGSGVTALVTDAAGRLYAGGSFREHAGAPADSLAVWDGSTWEPVGSALDGGHVSALAVDQASDVYAGGSFGRYNNVAMWSR